MQKLVFLLILVFTLSMVFASGSPSNSYILNDFVVRSLSSTMVFDTSKSFSIGLGYKQFSSESYLLGGFRFSRMDVFQMRFSGYLNIIVPVKYLDDSFLDGWWQKVWLDAWLYVSF